MTVKKIKTLSLFSGAGGLDIGFHNAGFDIIGCVEINKSYAATLEHNRSLGKYFSKTARVHCEDVRLFDVKQYASEGVECVIGGPPCQTFSAAGRRSGGVLGTDDARGLLFQTYCEILQVLQPRAFVFENVYGLPGANEGGPWREIVRAFSSLGYALTADVLDAADFGVPQHRERLFIIGVRQGQTLFEFPAPTHGPDSISGKPLTSVLDAIGDLPSSGQGGAPVGGLYGHLLESVPEGLNYSFFTREMGHPQPQFAWRSKFHDFLYKVDRNQPCRTIKAQPGKFTGPFHWLNRHFLVDELKRLQSFPDDYEIIGTYGKVVEQIGNSVPPALANVIATSVREQIFDRRRTYTFPVRPPGFHPTFRQRQRERTNSFKAIATQRIQEQYGNVQNLEKVRRQKSEVKTYNLLERFSLTEAHSHEIELGAQQFSAEFTQHGQEARLEVFESAQRKSLKTNVVIEIDGLEKYLDHLDKLVVTAKVADLGSVFGVWAIIQQTLVSHSRFFSLIDIYGHYANRGDTVNISTKVMGGRRSSLIKAIEFFGNSRNCGVLIPWEAAAESIGISAMDLVELVSQLRAQRYDVRSRESHVTLREEGVLCTYPFPMLSSKAHFDSAITPWVA
jgi:DNA (cytosine-5)-methyltransferase 1